MPFTGAISNQTAIRGGANFTRHVIIHTPDVIMQAQPSANASGLSNATITVGTPSSGTVAAVKADYTVLITPSTDYANDLQYRQQECHISYARLDGETSNISIGETTFQWTTSQYVTVLRDVRVFQRKHRYDSISKVEYRDYNISWRKPKPRIYDLYSEVLEISTGSTVIKAFTPSATSMSGGTISSWLWDADGNTISTGTSASQNISITFTAGTHLISLTVTDSNGIVNKLSVLIAVIPLDYNSVLATGMTVAQLQHDENGHVAGLQAYTDIEPYVPGSMAIVCTKVWFRDGTDTLTTDMVGWLGDVNYQTLGDETYQRLQSADVAILDVAYKANSIVIDQLPFTKATSPSAWAELLSCTPLDMAWHIISELSTLSNVSAVVYPSGYTNQVVIEYDTPNGSLVDVMKALAFNNNVGSLQFAPNGEIVFDVSLPYASTSVRDAATVIEAFSPHDASINLRYPPVGDFAVQYVNAGGTRYSTTEKKMADFYGRAPATTENGILEERIEYMVFPQDTTKSATSALTGLLAANHWAAANENLSGTLDNMLGGYLLVRQHQGVWYELDLSEEDLLNSDITFDNNTRFVCTSVSQSYDADTGSLAISMAIRAETVPPQSSVIAQELLAAILTADIPNMPNITAYPLLDESNPDDVYGDEFGENSAGNPDPSDTPDNADNTPDPPNVVESISVPLTGQTVTTSNTFASGSDFLVTVSGSGIVRPAGSDISLLNGNGQGASVAGIDGVNGGWTLPLDGPQNAEGSYNSGSDRYEATVQSSPLTAGSYSGGEIRVPVDSPTDISSITVTYESNTNDFTASVLISIYDSNIGFGTILASQNSNASGTLTYNGALSDGATLDILYRGRVTDPSISYCYITSIVITYAGGATGDGLFKIDGGVATAWGGAAGIQFNGSNVELANVSPSAYNPSHTYSFIATGTDSTWNFNFLDGDASYTENSGSLNVTIETIP